MKKIQRRKHYEGFISILSFKHNNQSFNLTSFLRCLKKNEELILIYFGDLDKDILTGKNAAIDSYRISDLIDFLKKVSMD